MKQRFKKGPAWLLATLLILLAGMAAGQLTPKTFEPAGAPLGTGSIQTMPTRGGALIGVMQALAPPNTVDLKSTGTRELYTSPTGIDTLITGVVFRVKTATSVSVNPIAGIGVASGESDILSPITLAGLSSGECLSFMGLGTGKVVTAGQTVKVGVDTAATATALDAEIILVGIPLP